jgi:hypothetical protein
MPASVSGVTKRARQPAQKLIDPNNASGNVHDNGTVIPPRLSGGKVLPRPITRPTQRQPTKAATATGRSQAAVVTSKKGARSLTAKQKAELEQKRAGKQQYIFFLNNVLTCAFYCRYSGPSRCPAGS